MPTVLAWSERMLTWSERPKSGASKNVRGLHYLVHGMALTLLRRIAPHPEEARRSDLNRAARELTTAAGWMESSRKYLFLCDVLLARATTLRYLGQIDAARADVDEVLGTSERCDMKLSEVDALILKGHLAVDEVSNSRIGEARLVLTRANELLRGTGYRLAEPAAALLGARVAHFEGKNPERELEAARESLDSIPVARLWLDLRDYESGHWSV